MWEIEEVRVDVGVRSDLLAPPLEVLRVYCPHHLGSFLERKLKIL